MQCFHLIVPYAVLSNSAALFLEYVHCRLNWTERGVEIHFSHVTWKLRPIFILFRQGKKTHFVGAQDFLRLPWLPHIPAKVFDK